MSTKSTHYSDSFGFQWLQHAKAQLDSVTGLPISRSRLFSVTGWPERMEGQRILEAGSGAGRFTEILLSTGAEVWSFDASEAVEANRANNGNHPRLQILTVEKLLEGQRIDYPPEHARVNVTFKKAPKARHSSKQLPLSTAD